MIPRRRGGEAVYIGISGGEFGDSSQGAGVKRRTYRAGAPRPRYSPRRGAETTMGDRRAHRHKVAVGSHVMFFRVQSDMVEIIRIPHRSMDVGRHIVDWPPRRPDP